MICKFNHEGDCCNCGSVQYMAKCKPEKCDCPMPITNYDRIRNMSVEEMAKELDKFEGLTNEICNTMTDCPYMDEDGNISVDCDCTGCIKQWLESEVTA